MYKIVKKKKGISYFEVDSAFIFSPHLATPNQQ